MSCSLQEDAQSLSPCLSLLSKGTMMVRLVVIVNLKQPRIICEESLSEGLSGSGGPVSLSVGGCHGYTGDGKAHSGFTSRLLICREGIGLK